MYVDSHIKAAKFMTYLLENRFRIFGVPFGIDPLLGFAPIVGDLISGALAFYIVWIGIQVGVPKEKIALMVRNILIDLVIGLVPVIGRVGDFIFRSNTKNLSIILQYYNPSVEGEVIERRVASAV